MSTPSTDPTTRTYAEEPDDATWLRGLANLLVTGDPNDTVLHPDEGDRLRVIADRLLSPVAPLGGVDDLMPGDGSCDCEDTAAHEARVVAERARSVPSPRGDDEQREREVRVDRQVRLALQIAGSVAERDRARDLAAALEGELAYVQQGAETLSKIITRTNTDIVDLIRRPDLAANSQTAWEALVDIVERHHEAAARVAADRVADRRPHSRACGIRPHPHGRLCSRDCPTCTDNTIARDVFREHDGSGS